MPKLSIDIGVKLGDSLGQLDKLNAALSKIDNTAKNISSSLKAIGNVKINTSINNQQPSAGPQSNSGPKGTFNEYIQGASSAVSITDVLESKLEELIQRSVSLKQTLSQTPVFDIQGFNETNSELKSVDEQIKKLQNTLKSQSLNIVSPKNVPDIFKEFRSGASSAVSAIDFLKQKEQDLVSKTNELKQSLSSQKLTASGFQATTRDIQELEKELSTIRGLLNLQSTDIFADFRSGAIQAATAIDYLEKKEASLIAESSNLRLALSTATSGEQYSQLAGKLDMVEVELNRVTSAIQKQSGALNNSSGSYTRLTAAQEAQRRVTNLSNLSLINFGRVAQDLPFGILGIANNLNPLIEGLKQTSDSAKAANTSLGKELLKSLSGFGGITLAVSAVSAALSFASVGLSYWSRSSKDASDSSDKLKEAEKQLEEQIKNTNDAIQSRSAYGDYLKDLNLLLAKGRGATKQELRKIEDDFFTSAENISFFDAFRKESVRPKGAIPRAEAEASDAAEAFKNSLISKFRAAAALVGDYGIPNAEELVTKFLNGYYNDATSGYNVLLGYLDEAGKKEVKKLKENYGAKEEIVGKLKEQYAILKATRGVEDLQELKNKNKENQRSVDIYKEINSDLEKISNKRNIDPLKKVNDSISRINSGLDEVVDKLGLKEINNPKFLELEKKLKAFRVQKITLEIENIKTTSSQAISNLKDKAKLLNVSTTSEQIKVLEDEINKLYEQYSDKNISIIDKEKVKKELDSIAAQLNQLQINKIFESGKKSFEEFGQDFKKLQIKGVLLNVSTNKEQLELVKKSIDSLLERRIELISKGDIDRASVIFALLSKIKALVPDLNIKILREDYDKTINELENKKLTLQVGAKIDESGLNNISQRIGILRQQIDETKSAFDKAVSFGSIDSNLKTYTDNLLKFLLEYSKLIKENKLIEDAENAAKIANNAIRDILGTLANTLAEGLGKAFAGESVDDLFKEGIKAIANTIKEAGKQLTTAAITIQLIKANLFKNPVVAIGAGIALTILGSFLESKLGFADGGFVSGPGSNRSDSIPARLSNGEFVINAKSVRKYGRGFMDMLNNGNIPISNYKNNFSDMRFADGGFVTRKMSGGIVGGSDLGGIGSGFIAETKISGQDLRLVLKRADSRFKNAT